MNRGNIKIKETEHHKFVVEVQTVDGNIWLTKHEMADLFNVHVGMVSNNLRAIFKSDILIEESVTRVHSFERNGKPCKATFYNLEALIFVSYRTASFEAQAFRQWVMKALCDYTKNGQNVHKREVLIMYNSGENLSSFIALN